MSKPFCHRCALELCSSEVAAGGRPVAAFCWHEKRARDEVRLRAPPMSISRRAPRLLMSDAGLGWIIPHRPQIVLHFARRRARARAAFPRLPTFCFALLVFETCGRIFA